MQRPGCVESVDLSIKSVKTQKQQKNGEPRPPFDADVAYAVKIIDRKKLKKKDDEGVFREVRVLKEFIGVPNIIQLIDFFTEPEKIFVVQELAAGGDVFDKLSQRKTYSEEDGRNLARVLLQAIDAMHHVKPTPVVHRDLKPENLLLADPNDDTNMPMRIHVCMCAF